MKSFEKNRLVIVRFEQDEDFYESLTEVCKKHKIKSAIILSAVGMLKDFELGYFKKKGNYAQDFFKEPHELISLNGIISKEKEKYLFHIHATLSNISKNAIGGHLIKAKVNVTNEIVLLKLNKNLKRKIDEKTGLNILDI